MSRILSTFLLAASAAAQQTDNISLAVEAMVAALVEAIVAAQTEAVVQRRVKEATEMVLAKARVEAALARAKRVRPDRQYRQGIHFLDRRQWDNAVEAFDAVVQANAERADG